MSRQLPPLNALRVFEAAARHLSFTRAADELHVTQAAVSHQVKALEDWVGQKLFRRLNRALALTDAGQAYLPVIRDAFDRIDAGTARLRRSDRAGHLTVSVLASFAALWLVPRLGRFSQAHPEVEVRVSANDRMVDFTADDVDCAIRYGRGGWAGLRADHLLSENIFPVCAPELLEGAEPLRRPEDLRRFTLLHESLREDWRMWLLAAGVKGVDHGRGPTFSHSTLVMKAAMSGHGVALGRSVLVADELAAGRLVRPFELSLPAEYGYYVVAPVETAERPKVRAFREWLLEERQRETA